MADNLDPTVWMPRFIFVLQSMAHCYPHTPNDVMRQKTYNIIHDLPITMPHADWQKRFCNLLDEYPVSPYLKSRDAFTMWVYFVRNRVYMDLGLGPLPMSAHHDAYYDAYLPPQLSLSERVAVSKRSLVLGIIAVCGACVFYGLV